MRNLKLSIALLSALAIPVFIIPPVTAAEPVLTAAKTKWPECFCTDRYGKRRELGDIICLNVGGRSYQAKCVMAQNVPFWRDLSKGCLSSSLPANRSFARVGVTAIYR